MRPIDKGSVPNAYPYDIELGNDIDLADTLKTRGGQWTFSEQVIKTLYNYKKTPTPLTPWGALLALLVVALGKEPPVYPPKDSSGFPLPAPPTLKLSRAAKVPLNDRVAKEYQKAAAPLGDRIGKFCCYCDQTLPGQIAVEHILPKAPYPLTAIAWDNFLLACEVCNGNKGNRPSRAEMKKWAPPVEPKESETGGYRAMRSHYLWPDISPNVFTEYRPQLYYYEMGTDDWEAVPGPSALGGSLVSAVLSTRQVTAALPAPLGQQEVRATMVPTQKGSPAANSQKLLGLWKDGTEQVGGKISDTRMFNRTLAWFRAQKILGPAIEAAKAGNKNLFDGLWAGVLAAAPAIGFFSVWIRLLELYNAGQVYVPGIQPQTDVGNYFLTQTTTTPGCFPNTRTDGL